MPILKKIFGDPNAREIKRVKAIVDRVNKYTEAVAKLDDTKLQQKTTELKKQLKSGKSLDDLLPEAFAVVRSLREGAGYASFRCPANGRCGPARG